MNNKINYFKRELMNYRLYKNTLLDIELKLQMIALEISGVSAPNMQDPVIENRTYVSPINKFGLLEDERKYIEKRDNFNKLVKQIDLFLESLSPELKRVVMNIYVLSSEKDESKTYSTYAKELNYSVNGLKKIIDKKIMNYIKSKELI